MMADRFRASFPWDVSQTQVIDPLDNTHIARAHSILVGLNVRPGPITPSEARAVIAWHHYGSPTAAPPRVENPLIRWASSLFKRLT